MNDIELNKKLINLMESSMSEAAKPDFADIDDDGDEKETMKKAAKDKDAKEKVKEAHPGPKSEKAKQTVKCQDADGKEYTKTVTAVNPTAASKEVKANLPKGHRVIGSTKVTEDENLNSLKSALRSKMDEMMASTSSMPKKSAPVLDNEGVNGYEDYMVGEEEETDEAVLDEAELDEMAEMMRMAGISEDPHATTSSMPRTSAPTKGPEQVNGYEDYMVGEAEDDEERDDHAEKAGREVAHDMEYDDGHDAEDDDHDEKEGRHVAKDIEFDEKEHEAMKSILQKLMK